MSEILLITLPPVIVFLLCVCGCSTLMRRRYQMRNRLPYIDNSTPVFVPTVVQPQYTLQYSGQYPGQYPGQYHNQYSVQPYPTQMVPQTVPMVPNPSAPPLPSAPPYVVEVPTTPYQPYPYAHAHAHPHSQGVGGQGYYAPNVLNAQNPQS